MATNEVPSDFPDVLECSKMFLMSVNRVSRMFLSLFSVNRFFIVFWENQCFRTIHSLRLRTNQWFYRKDRPYVHSQLNDKPDRHESLSNLHGVRLRQREEKVLADHARQFSSDDDLRARFRASIKERHPVHRGKQSELFWLVGGDFWCCDATSWVHLPLCRVSVSESTLCGSKLSPSCHPCLCRNLFTPAWRLEKLTTPDERVSRTVFGLLWRSSCEDL